MIISSSHRHDVSSSPALYPGLFVPLRSSARLRARCVRDGSQRLLTATAVRSRPSRLQDSSDPRSKVLWTRTFCGPYLASCRGGPQAEAGGGLQRRERLLATLGPHLESLCSMQISLLLRGWSVAMLIVGMIILAAATEVILHLSEKSQGWQTYDLSEFGGVNFLKASHQGCHSPSILKAFL